LPVFYSVWALKRAQNAALLRSVVVEKCPKQQLVTRHHATALTLAIKIAQKTRQESRIVAQI
jgi:hypothetical protein